MTWLTPLKTLESSDVIEKFSLVYTDEDKWFRSWAQTKMMTNSAREVNRVMEEAINSSNIKSCYGKLLKRLSEEPTLKRFEHRLANNFAKNN